MSQSQISGRVSCASPHYSDWLAIMGPRPHVPLLSPSLRWDLMGNRLEAPAYEVDIKRLTPDQVLRLLQLIAKRCQMEPETVTRAVHALGVLLPANGVTLTATTDAEAGSG